MVVTIKGEKYWLWRAVDANGYVLDALLRSRRNRRAALRLLRKLLKGQGTAPRVLAIDKLHLYSAAKAELTPGVGIFHRRGSIIEPRIHIFLYDSESANDALQVRETTPAFGLTHGQIANLFLLHRKHLTAANHRQLRAQAISTGDKSLCRLTQDANRRNDDVSKLVRATQLWTYNHGRPNMSFSDLTSAYEPNMEASVLL